MERFYFNYLDHFQNMICEKFKIFEEDDESDKRVLCCGNENLREVVSLLEDLKYYEREGVFDKVFKIERV